MVLKVKYFSSAWTIAKDCNLPFPLPKPFPEVGTLLTVFANIDLHIYFFNVSNTHLHTYFFKCPYLLFYFLIFPFFDILY